MFIPLAGAQADGFHDPGLQYAKVRTDYNATDAGTYANPLTYVTPCVYSSWLRSGGHARPYPDCAIRPPDPQSNYWQQNGGGSSPTFWVLSLNNEQYESSANSGPPNQSLPRVPAQAQGVMGVVATIDYAGGEDFWRLALILDKAGPPALVPDGIPYLSVGAAADRGNGGYIGWFNDANAPDTVMFTDKLGGYHVGTDANWGVSHQLVVTAKWGGEYRMMQIYLFYDGVFGGVPWHGVSQIDESPTLGPCQGDGYGPCGGGTVWNWPIQESFFYPGANIALMDAAAMSMPAVCGMNIPVFGSIGDQITYTVDLEKAFRCASDWGMFTTPMPVWAPVPIVGVHWAVEAYGHGAGVWVSVHNMRMLPLPPPWPPLVTGSGMDAPLSPPTASLPGGVDIPTYLAEHPTIAEMQTSFKRECNASPPCAKANEWMVPGASIPERPGPGVVGQLEDVVRGIKPGSRAGE